MKLLILIAYFIVLITIGFVCRQKATDVNGICARRNVLSVRGLLLLLLELRIFCRCIRWLCRTVRLRFMMLLLGQVQVCIL